MKEYNKKFPFVMIQNGRYCDAKWLVLRKNIVGGNVAGTCSFDTITQTCLRQSKVESVTQSIFRDALRDMKKTYGNFPVWPLESNEYLRKFTIQEYQELGVILRSMGFIYNKKKDLLIIHKITTI